MIRALLVWLAFGLLFQRASSQEFQTVSFKERVEAWAVDSATERVFAAFNESPSGHAGQVIEVNRQGKQLQTFLLDAAPRRMMMVKDRLVVLSISPLQVTAFDLKTNQPAGSLKIPGVGAGATCSGGRESPYLYVFNNAADGKRVPQMLQIDVRQMTLRKQIALDQYGGPSYQDAVVSRDGKRLVCRSGSRSTMQYALDEDTGILRSERRFASEPRGRIKMDPTGAYWSVGSRVRSFDSSEIHGEFEGSSLAIHPHLDLAVGYGARELVLQQLSDATEIDRVSLHRPFADSRGMTSVFGQSVQLQFMDNGQALFLGEPNYGHWVDLAPLQTSLKRRIEPSGKGRAGELGNEALTKKIPVDFVIRGIEFSPSGQRAVLWGAQSSLPARQLAIVDLKEDQVTETHTITTGIRCAAIDDAYVYVAPQSGRLVDRYGAGFKQPKKAFVKAEPARLIPYGQEWLICQSHETQRLNRQTLLTDMPTIQLPNQRTSFSAALLDRQTLAINGQVIDRKTQKLLRYHAESCLPVISKAVFDLHLGQRARINLWSHSIRDGKLMGHDGISSAISRSRRKIDALFEPIASAISQIYPYEVCLGKLFKPNRGVSKCYMEIRRLPDGKRIDLIALPELDDLVFRDLSVDAKSLLIHVIGDSVYLVAGEALLKMPLPDSVISDKKRPVCFSRQQPTNVFEVGGEESFQLNVDGEREGGSFCITVPVPGMKIDKLLGKVTLDTPVMWKAFAKSTQARRSSRRGFGRRTIKGQLPIEAYELKSNQLRYQWLTGEEPKPERLAAHFPIAVEFQDATGNVDSVRFSMVLTGPASTPSQKTIASSKVAERKTTSAQELNKIEKRIRRMEAVLDGISLKLDAMLDQ